MKILFLGAGKMIEAMLVGLKDKKDFSDIGIYSPSGVSASELAKKVGAKWVEDLSSVAPEWIVIGCKPQDLKNLKTTIGNNFSKALFISVLAAVSEESQLKVLGAHRLIRLMPNLAVKHGQGVLLLASASAQLQNQDVKKFFQGLGLIKEVAEKELDELTLLTGSGPAFFYEFTSYLAQGFGSLSVAEREELSRQVFLGAALSAKAEKESLEVLTSKVTSKGGVTIAVLEKWRKDNLKGIIFKGLEAGKNRVQELKALIRQS